MMQAALIQQNIAIIHTQIQSAATRDQSCPVTLIAVSKKQPVAAVEAAYLAGQRDFGENYVQEGVEKIAALSKPDVVWHFIGHLQSNKSQAVAAYFSWVHSVDRIKIANTLDAARADTGLPPLQVCVQVNIDDGQHKAGVQADEVAALCQHITQLPHLKLRGLMAIPEPGNADALVAMQQLFLRLQPRFGLDVLSMGMSGDFEQAIACGATHVRVGTAVFGARQG